MNKAEKVVRYYVLCNTLKDVIRTGWQNVQVQRERIESVAEHIFGVQALAIVIHSEYQYDLDLEKVLYMLAVHDLEEIVLGDLTEFQITESEKIENGKIAVSEILAGMISREKITELLLEFTNKETLEAKFAYHCDKLECDLQCKLYDEENCVSLENDICRNDTERRLLEQEKTWSGMWMEYDRPKYKDDENFEEILDFAKTRKISINKK